MEENKISKIKMGKNWKRFSMVAMVLLVVLFGFFYNQFVAKGVIFGWAQSAWSTADTVTTAVHNADQSTWTKFFSKDANVDVTTNSSEAKLTGTNAVVVATTDADFNSFTPTNTYVSSGTIYAKKPNGGSCSGGGECVSGVCISSTCTIACSDGAMTCGQSCGYYTDKYATVQIGARCWFKEDLRTTQTPGGADITALAKCLGAGCASPWGRYYLWTTAMNISSSYKTVYWNSATSADAKLQGICPGGWHIPSYNDMTALNSSASGLSTHLGATTGWGAYNGDNSTGFSAMPSGLEAGGTIYDGGTRAYFMNSKESTPTQFYWLQLSGSGSSLWWNLSDSKGYGMPVRCVKD